MSNSLVHKSLELLDNEKDLQGEKKKKKCKHIEYKGTLNLMPNKYRFTSKQDEKDLNNIPGYSSKITVYETQKRLASKYDCTDENVQRLLSFSNKRINPDIVNKMFHRAVKQKYIRKKQKRDKSETTAFTEEDFKKFEQEYTG